MRLLQKHRQHDGSWTREVILEVMKSGYILKMNLSQFVDELNMDYKKMRAVKDVSKFFHLS